MMQKIALLFLFLPYNILGISQPKIFICHPYEDFKCLDGMCIPIERTCDNIPDCNFGEDESDCHYLNKCEAGLFMCQDGECEPRESRCNGKRDCADGSDEFGCQKEEVKSFKTQKPKTPLRPTISSLHSLLSLCHPHIEFRCNDGTCLPLERQCDNVKDCDKGEDELNCVYKHHCNPGMFSCHSGECLFPNVRCNGIPNCADGSDELGCQKEVTKSPKAQKPKSRSKPQPTCDLHKEFECPESKCIPIEHHCDNIPDCDKGEDEKDCHYLHICEPGLFMCASGECLRPEVKCNGAKNCYDGSDELGCPPVKPHFSPKANAPPNPSQIAASKSSQTLVPTSNPSENCKKNESYFCSFLYFLCGRYPYVRYRRDLFVDHVTNVFKKSPAKSFLPKCDAEHGPNVSLLEESPALS